MRAERGQSTVEYAVLVLVALVLLAAGAAGLHATGIAGAVLAQMERALCIVTGGRDCSGGEEPCVVASRATLDDTSVRIALLRLRAGRTLLRERRSDGSERVTLVMRGGAGAGLGVGGEVRIGSLAAGGRVDAALEVRGGRGRVWILPSTREADALVRRLSAVAASHPRASAVRVRAPVGPAPQPDVTFGDRGLATSGSGALGPAGVALEADDLVTTRVDRRSGERTLVVRRRNDLLAHAGLAGSLRVEGGGRADTRAALVVDRAGNPLRLELTASSRLQAGVRLPPGLGGIAERHGVPQRRGRLVETTTTLDLGDPANLAAAAMLVRALRDPGLDAGRVPVLAAGLRRRFTAAGRQAVRVYALDGRRTGAGGGVDVGIGLGAGHEHVVEQLRLEGAADRDGAGPWHSRVDCLGGA